jgi:hypothetical protein
VPPLDGLPASVRNRLLKTLEQVSTVARQELQKLTVAELLSVGDD